MRIEQAKGKIRQPKKCLDRGGGEIAWRFQEGCAARTVHATGTVAPSSAATCARARRQKRSQARCSFAGLPLAADQTASGKNAGAGPKPRALVVAISVFTALQDIDSEAKHLDDFLVGPTALAKCLDRCRKDFLARVRTR